MRADRSRRAADLIVRALDAAALAACVLIGGENAPLFVASVALHEGAHLAAMRLCGARGICFASAALGFRLRYGASPLSRRERLAVTLAGCAANAALAAASLALGAFCRVPASFASSLFRFAAINLSLAAFNLLPIAGLDGGEALAVILKDLAEPRRAYALCRAFSISFTLALWLFATFVQLCAAPVPEILLAASLLLFRELTR